MNEGPFDGMRPAAPPAGLRGRALRAARMAPGGASRVPQPRWGFSGFDLAWVAALAALVIANVMLSDASRKAETITASRPAPIAPHERIAGPEANGDLAVRGLNMGGGPPHRAEPALSLEQALRAAS